MGIQYSTYASPRLDIGQALMESDAMKQRYIAEEVLPIMPVDTETGTYSVIAREGQLAKSDAARAADGTYNRVDAYAEDATYTCKEYGLEGVVDDKKKNKYISDFDLEMVEANRVWGDLRLNTEAIAAAAVFNTDTWTGSALYTDVSSAPWDAAASDAIGHVIAAGQKVIQNTGIQPNVLIIGQPTWINLLGNTAIKARFPGIERLSLTDIADGLAPIFGLEKIIIGSAVYNSAKEGQTFSGSFIWGDDYAMVARLSDGGFASGGLGKTVVWTTDGNFMQAETYREEQRRANIVRVRHSIQHVIVDKYCGHLLKVDA